MGAHLRAGQSEFASSIHFGTHPRPASNLTLSGDIGQWQAADFINTIRTGLNPAGKTLDQRMPWFRYRAMSDDELRAFWLFLQATPAKAFGSR